MNADMTEEVEEPGYLLLASSEEGRWDYQDTEEVDVIELVYRGEDTPMKVKDGEIEASVGSFMDEGRARSFSLVEDYFDTEQRGYLLTGSLEFLEEDSISEGERIAARLDHINYPNLDVYFVEEDEQKIEVYRDPFEGKISDDEKAESMINTILNGGEREVLQQIEPAYKELKRRIDVYNRINGKLENGESKLEEFNTASDNLRKQMFRLHDTLIRSDITLVSESRLNHFDNQIERAERLLMEQDDLINKNNIK